MNVDVPIKETALLLVELAQIDRRYETDSANMQRDIGNLTVKEDQIKANNTLALSYCEELLHSLRKFIANSRPNETPAEMLVVRLLTAIGDLLNGSKEPTLFNILSTNPKAGAYYEAPFGKGKGTLGASAQGSLAFALELLIRGGFKTTEAVDWLDAELRANNIVDRAGQPVSGKRVGDWRYHFNEARGALAGRLTFDHFNTGKWWPDAVRLMRSPPSDIKKAKSERLAREIIKRVAFSARQEISAEL